MHAIRSFDSPGRCGLMCCRWWRRRCRSVLSLSSSEVFSYVVDSLWFRVHKILCTTAYLFPQRGSHHRAEALPLARDRPQSLHQPPKDSLLGVMVAIADTDSSGVTPDLGREKEKTQAGLP